MTSSPVHFNLNKVIRPNILALQPYRCARDDYSSGILLDANENAFGPSIAPSSLPPSSADATSPFPLDTTTLDLHRYPDPSHPLIKQRLATLRGLPSTDHVFLGVGSDEVIDLLMRVCVVPGGEEKILITPPTYGMYSVCAQVNDVGVVKVPLELSGERGEGGVEGRFSVRVDEIKKAVLADPSIKLIFLCSPGNPTGTLLSLSSIRALLDFPAFKGIVVVDEAYIDFAQDPTGSAAGLVQEYGNLCVMQTLSKSFGLAAIRLGIALAQPPLIQILTNTKAPYNISTPSASLALAALSPPSIALMQSKVAQLTQEREGLMKALGELRKRGLGMGEVRGGNDANFLVVPILEKASASNSNPDKPSNTRAHTLYKTLAETSVAEGGAVVVRFRGNEPGCEGCLRMTVGTKEENAVLVERVGRVLEEI